MKIKLFLFSVLLSASYMVHAWPWHDAGSHGGNGVGAPLDGGLLALLAAGGITYYLGRKRKEK